MAMLSPRSRSAAVVGLPFKPSLRTPRRSRSFPTRSEQSRSPTTRTCVVLPRFPAPKELPTKSILLQYCIFCKDGGILYECANCPRTAHAKCSGYKTSELNSMVSYRCLQHVCQGCSESSRYWLRLLCSDSDLFPPCRRPHHFSGRGRSLSASQATQHSWDRIHS